MSNVDDFLKRAGLRSGKNYDKPKIPPPPYFPTHDDDDDIVLKKAPIGFRNPGARCNSTI